METLGGTGGTALPFFTSALDEVSGQSHAPASLHPRERASGSHWIRSWVGPRAGLDAMEKGKSCSAGNQTRVVQPVARAIPSYPQSSVVVRN
jgi:hypothetical protein